MGWTVEERYLFQLVRQSVYDNLQAGQTLGAAVIQVPGVRFNWDFFVERAIDGGTAPMAYVALSDGDASPPDGVMEQLRTLYRLSAAENMQYLACTRRLLLACEEEALHPIVLRGTLFAEWLYSDMALRPFGDIDLLVRPEQLYALETLLETQGYERIPGHDQQWTNHVAVIDVHTDLVGGDRIAARRRAVRIDMEAIWKASTPTAVAGAPARRLCWADQLLTCALHAIKHSCDRLLWFADMAALIRMPQRVSLEALTVRARQFGLEKPLYYMLDFLRETIGTPVPEAMMASLKPLKAGWIEQRLMRRVLRGEQVGRFGEVFNLFLFERNDDRWSFIKETFFPRQEVLTQSYGLSGTIPWKNNVKRIWHVADMTVKIFYSRNGMK